MQAAQKKLFEVNRGRVLEGARTMTVDLKTHKLYMPSADYGPAPEATAANPRPRPSIVTDSFKILVLSQ